MAKETFGNVQITQNPGSLELSRRSKGIMGYFFIFFGGIWLLFTSFLLTSVISGGSSGPIDWSGLLLSIPLLLLGLFMLYFGIVSAFNRSVIRIENGRLAKENEPLPWFGSRSYSTFDVNQVFVQTGMRESSFGGTTQFYDLMMDLKDGKKARLLSGISSFNDAKRLEQMVEEFLHICDREVDKECTESQSQRVLNNIDTIGSDATSSMTKAHLTMKGRLNPSWELSTYDEGSIISTFAPDRGIGFNRPLFYTAAILVGMFSIIFFLGLSSTDGFPFQLLFIPLVLIIIMLFAFRTMGTRTYATKNGRFQYRARRTKGKLNTMGYDCISVTDRSCLFVADNKEVRFNDGAVFSYVSGATFLGGGRNNIFQADLRNVNIMLFEGNGQVRDRNPVVIIKDMSGPQQAQAEVYLAPRDGRDRYIDQLTGFAINLFHLYKTNPNFYD
jgi:hypothetical protein